MSDRTDQKWMEAVREWSMRTGTRNHHTNEAIALTHRSMLCIGVALVIQPLASVADGTAELVVFRSAAMIAVFLATYFGVRAYHHNRDAKAVNTDGVASRGWFDEEALARSRKYIEDTISQAQEAVRKSCNSPTPAEKGPQ